MDRWFVEMGWRIRRGRKKILEKKKKVIHAINVEDKMKKEKETRTSTHL